MGKHYSAAQKAQYLTYRECGKSGREAAKLSGIKYSAADLIYARTGAIWVEHDEQCLPPPTIDEQVARKPGSGRKKVLSDEDCQAIFDACPASKTQRKKRQHEVSLEEGFNACRRTVEARMRKMNLFRTKPTKKLALTDFQKAQRYEIVLSRANRNSSVYKV